MPLLDLSQFAWRSICSHKQRSLLTALGLIIGIASVVILTSIGRGVHQFVLNEFTQFGTHLMAVYPGKTSTLGLSGATISTVRPLSLEDAQSLQHLENIEAITPLVQGNARVEAGNRQRRANVMGVGGALPHVWRIAVDIGHFFSEDGQNASRAFAVLGSKMRAELFGNTNPLGQRIRIGNDRFRVIGVMQSKGQMLGFDLDDTVYIPAEQAMALFDRQSLMEIDVLYRPDVLASSVEQAIKRLLITRHGDEDFTLITQNQMLKKMDSVLNILTMAVAALGSVSLLVGSVGILTIMSIAVSERITEIGLLRAIGAERRVIFRLFLGEALLLSVAGGMLGVLLGIVLVKSIVSLLPQLPVVLAWNYVVSALAVSVLIGIAAGVMPAMQAARMNPLAALRAD